MKYPALSWKQKLLIAGVTLLAFGLLLWSQREAINVFVFAPMPPTEPTRAGISSDIPATPQNISSSSFSIVAENLSIPWEVLLLPDGQMLVTERTGSIKRLGQDGATIPITGVRHVGEGGLLGLARDPNFSQNQFLYVYLTRDAGAGFENRVERYRLENDELKDRKLVLGGIPGARYHDGGRIAFGPDGYLYIATGDSGRERLAQDRTSLAGKILRIGSDGSIPSDNPFGNAVYSLGHRNVQGLAWDDRGNLWATEHGRSGLRSGFDELNKIVKGGNYGWPDVEGDEVRDSMISPVLHSGADMTWAPSGAAFFGGSIFFSGLRGERLYEAKLDQGRNGVSSLVEHFPLQFGRLRAVVVGQDGYLYVSTSNTDGRGIARRGDDRIIKVPLSSFGQ